MKDPLLLTHAIREQTIPAPSPFLFDISSRLQPISIRDQFFRGAAIIRRALNDGLLRKGQTEPILVIGGGAAGIMATMVAMQNWIPVVLVERERLFAVQAPSGRRVCATEYDWPAPHWSRGNYPPDASTAPLQLVTSDVPALLLKWESQLQLWKKTYPNTLKEKIGTEFRAYEVRDGAASVQLDPPDAMLPPFKMIVSCAGFGLERTWVPDVENIPVKYRGFAFWEEDPLTEPDLGIKSGDLPNIFISGGGDGALQDFLRITCRQSAGNIYRDLISQKPSLGTFIEERIFKAEDRAMRRYVWGTLGSLDCAIHRQLQSEHQAVVDLLASDRKVWQSIGATFNSMMGRLNERLNLRLGYPCDHFSSCYPLNRFLVLLVSKYLQQQLGRSVLQPEIKIVDVDSVDHNCLETSFKGNGTPHRSLPGDPFHCHGKKHILKYAAADCLTFVDAGSEPAKLAIIDGGPFNIVIIRHGIKPGKLPLKHTAAALPMRQLIPYDHPF